MFHAQLEPVQAPIGMPDEEDDSIDEEESSCSEDDEVESKGEHHLAVQDHATEKAIEMLLKFDRLKLKYCPQTICASINTQRKNGEFCDIAIEVDGIAYPAHKMVLANFSPVFSAMFRGEFSESSQTSVTLTDIEGDIMECLLDFIYSGEISMTPDNAQGLLQAAHFLQADPLFELGCHYLENNINDKNCLSILHLGKLYSGCTLEKTAATYFFKNFAKVREEDEFLEMGQDTMINLISNNCLIVEEEKVVFEAVMKWMEFKEEERLEHFDKVLREVRLVRLDRRYLNDRFLGDARLRKSGPCMHLLQLANSYWVLGDERVELCPSIARRRNNSPKMEVALVQFRLSENDRVILLSEDGRIVNARNISWLDEEEYVYDGCTVHNHTAFAMRQEIHWDCFEEGQYENCSCARYVFNNGVWNSAWVALDKEYYYCIGGLSESAVRTVHRYDIFSRSWRAVAPLPEAVFNAAAVSHGGAVYVIGGYIEKLTPSGVMQIYNPRTDSWRLSPLPLRPLYEPSACALNTCIYVCSKVTKKSMFVLDVLTGQWQHGRDLNYDFVSGLVVVNGRIWAISQTGEGGDRFIEQYSPETDSWNLFATFPGARPLTLKGPILVRRNREDVQHEGIEMILL